MDKPADRTEKSELLEQMEQLKENITTEQKKSAVLRQQVADLQRSLDVQQAMYNHRSVRIALSIEHKIDQFNRKFHLSKYKVRKKSKKTTQEERPMSMISYDSWYEDNVDYSDNTTDIKPIVFYLPQFHSFKENDEWWGKGFTEWTNTKKAVPRFLSHYEPREPHKDFGYYDLSDWHTLDQQARLAKQHGIYGFCIYRYWFAGKELMETPLNLLLEHPEIEMNYCLCWANENWTRKWDGDNSSVLIGQTYENDSVEYIADLKRFLDDPRYIRVDGKPVVMIYRPNLLPDAAQTFRKWRQWARENGIGEILIWIQRGVADMGKSVMVEGADAEVEFPPSGTAEFDHYDVTQAGGEQGSGNLIGYQRLVDEVTTQHATVDEFSHTVYRGITLGWDNSPRRDTGWWASWGFSLADYYRWLTYLVSDTRMRHDKDKRFIFINAWNEWAEGTYLEPDKRFGYSSINVTSRAIFDMPLHPHIDGYPTGNHKDPYEEKKANNLISRNLPLFPYSLFSMYHGDELTMPAKAWQQCNELENPVGTLEELRKRFEADTQKTFERLHLQRIKLKEQPLRKKHDSDTKTAIHLHLFYQDMIGIFNNYFDNIPYPFDLYISIPEGVKYQEEKIIRKFQGIKNVQNIIIRSCPNRGRDIAPLICTFGKELTDYDYIAHFHSKKSLHSNSLSGWSEYIFSHLMGSEENISRIFHLLDNNVGLVAPPDYLIMPEQPSGWGSNMAIAQEFLQRCQIHINLKEEFPVIEFPQGSMFWASVDYLRPMLNAPLSFNDFPAEPIGMDGTIAHALERLLYLWGVDSGKEIRQIFLDGEEFQMYVKR